MRTGAFGKSNNCKFCEHSFSEYNSTFLKKRLSNSCYFHILSSIYFFKSNLDHYNPFYILKTELFDFLL